MLAWWRAIRSRSRLFMKNRGGVWGEDKRSFGNAYAWSLKQVIAMTEIHMFINKIVLLKGLEMCVRRGWGIMTEIELTKS